MLWPWQHAAIHRAIIRAHDPWAPGEEAECWRCGKHWRADLRYPGILHVTKNKKTPRP